uniref:Uncharacterized protein n=1 Tax=Desulfobacca acetoxidans TaxID=60893 RepID=A0A7C3WPS5_9BACT
MKKLAALLVNLFLLALPALAWAAGPGEKVPDMATRQVKVEGLSCINAFFASWYNTNKMVFALAVTVLMGVVGGLIAFCTDIFLKLIGMDVSKIEHHE